MEEEANRVMPLVLGAWGKEVGLSCDKLKAKLPSRQAVESPLLLTSEEARKSLEAIAKDLGSCGVYADSGALVNVWSAYEKEHKDVQLLEMTMLMKLRKMARLTITVDWAIHQVVNLVPNKPEEIPEHGAMILAKMHAKGVGTPTGVPCPSFLLKVLESMKVAKPKTDSAEMPPEPVAASASASAPMGTASSSSPAAPNESVAAAASAAASQQPAASNQQPAAPMMKMQGKCKQK